MCLLNYVGYMLFRQLLVPMVLYLCGVNYVGYIALAISADFSNKFFDAENV